MFDEALAVRDDERAWRPVHENGAVWPKPLMTDAQWFDFFHAMQAYESGTKSERCETEGVWTTLKEWMVEGEVVRLFAFRQPLTPAPGWYRTIKLKLTVSEQEEEFARLTLMFSRPSLSPKPPPVEVPRGATKKELRALRWFVNLVRRGPGGLSRRSRKQMRSLWDLGDPPSRVPLVPDDAELRALVALRCVQQEYRADAAMKELHGYAQRLGVRDVPEWGVRVDDIVSRVVEKFVSSHRPGALPRYIRLIKLAVVAEARKERAGALPYDAMRERIRGDEDGEKELLVSTSPSARRKNARGELLTVPEASRVSGIPLRTLYRWIELGIVMRAEKDPCRIARAEVERLRTIRAARNDIPSIPKLVLRLRQEVEKRKISYRSALMWVRRRRAKGLSDREIIEEAAQTRQEEAAPVARTEARKLEWKGDVRREREASLRRQARRQGQDR